jgi:hypothetical protein
MEGAGVSVVLFSVRETTLVGILEYLSDMLFLV